MKNKELPEDLVEEVAEAVADIYGRKPDGHRYASSDAIAQAALSVIAPYYEKQIAELEYRREIFNDTRKLLLGDEEIDLEKTYNLSGLHLGQIIQSHSNLEKQIAELKAQIPQWLPISEAPKDGSDVIVYRPNGKLRLVEVAPVIGVDYWGEARCGEGAWMKSNFTCEPTHFMHLPKPPAE